MAFPSLLEGSEGLSTMRIVVFMVTNVVCMLLLKIGWAEGITSLDQIGIDQYWVGIIAFAFGAKATQSFFESRMAVPKESEAKGTLDCSNADIAKLAVAQYEKLLKIKFPNIASVSDSVTQYGGSDSHNLTIYLKDDNDAGIPTILEVNTPYGNKTIKVEIVKNVGVSEIQYSQSRSEVAREDFLNFTGSLCCGVTSTIDGNDFRGIVTSGHIYTKGLYKDDYNGLLDVADQTNAMLNGTKAGKWYYKMLNANQDLMVVALDEEFGPDQDYKKFGNEFYEVGDGDVRTEKKNVTMMAHNNRSIEAFILDYNIGLDINYDNGPAYKGNVILIGSTNKKDTSKPISAKGDSGACVYHTQTGALIGILLGKNEKYSLVLPVRETLKTFNLKTI